MNEIHRTAISLFAGAGGCSLGFKKAGYDIKYAMDIDLSTVETYRRNFPDTECIQADIRDIDFMKLMSYLSLDREELDILIGGPPCQGFSTAGAKFWEDPRNRLLKSYVYALEMLQPKWFIMENVEGLLTARRGIYIYEVIKAFIECGYYIRVEKVYAQEYGVPQRRKRVFIIGNRLGYDFTFPEPSVKVSGSIFRNSDITLYHAIGELPEPASDKETPIQYTTRPQSELQKKLRDNTNYVTDHYFLGMNKLDMKRIHALEPGQTMKDLPVELQHTSFRRRAYRRVMDGTPTEKRGGAPSGLKRLIYSEPSLTITGASTREFIHPIQDRPLTIRECARIQTFPDSFEFVGTPNQKIRLIGNAIPPLLAQIFAKYIVENYGFGKAKPANSGRLLGFLLTKSTGKSPALKHTEILLQSLCFDAQQLSFGEFL